MTDKLTLGALIETTRKSKNIRIKTLIENANVSRSTYNRIVNDETVVSMDVLIQILAVVQLDINEITNLIPNYDILPLNQMKQTALLMNYWTQGTAQQQRLIQHVAALKVIAEQTKLDGSRVNYEYGEMALCQLRNDAAGTRHHGELIYEIVADYEDWTNFEITSVGEISSYIKPEWMPMLTRKMERFEAKIAFSTDYNDMFLTNTLYLNLLQSALNGRSLPLLERTVEMVEKRIVRTGNFIGLLTLKYVKIVAQMLKHEPGVDFIAAFAAFIDGIEVFTADQLVIGMYREMGTTVCGDEWQLLLTKQR